MIHQIELIQTIADKLDNRTKLESLLDSVMNSDSIELLPIISEHGRYLVSIQRASIGQIFTAWLLGNPIKLYKITVDNMRG